MTLEQLAYLAQIVGVFAVVLTLIYLAIQTKQNTDAVEATSRHAVIASDLVCIQSMMDHPSIAKSLYSGELSSAEEKVALEGFLLSLARTREHHWLQYRRGLLDRKTMESFLTGLTYNISFPRSRLWWDVMAQHYFDPDFVEDVNKRLSGIPIHVGSVHPFDLEQ